MPKEVINNLNDMEDTEEPFESIEEIWLDYPTDEDYINLALKYSFTFIHPETI